MRDKIEAMKIKLRTWIRRIESNVFEMFPNYSQMITDIVNLIKNIQII